MKAHLLLARAGLGLLFLLGGVSQLPADITVRLSVKFIRKPDGTWPAAGNVGTVQGFAAEVTRANAILVATGRGYQLEATYLDIQPPPPANQPPEYWFDLPARADGNLQLVEAAALANEQTWRWDRNAINAYVNDSTSGQCSSPGGTHSILWGSSTRSVTVLHEVGHFFGLQHTHAGDPKCDILPPPYPVADGDGLGSTIRDHACLDTDADGLSTANFNERVFAQLNASEQAQVNSSWLNVMSYHPTRALLTDEQMDWVWTFWINFGVRSYVCDGRTWFVSSVYGDDDMWSGAYPGQAFRTIGKALGSVSGQNDVVLIQTPGTYPAPTGNVLANPCTLRATGGPVTIVRSP